MIQGKSVLDVARQIAAEANYSDATGLHATSLDEHKSPVSSPGCLAADNVIAPCSGWSSLLIGLSLGPKFRSTLRRSLQPKCDLAFPFFRSTS